MQHLLNSVQQRTVDNQVRAWLLVGGVLLWLLGGVIPPAPVQAQGFTFPISESFSGASAPGWVLGGTAVLTSGGADPADDGWLRLTDAVGYRAGYAYYDTPIPTGRGLVVTFDYGAWGGTGADGLSFFLFDGTTTTFKVGASGGSLGYAQKTGINGLSGGYLGLGLDEFGNYSNFNEGRAGGPGYLPNAVAVRGPGSGTTGYAYLAGTTRLDRAPWNLPRLDCPSYLTGCGNGVTRPPDTVYYRQVRITVTPVGAAYQVAVAMKFTKNATTWTTLFGPFTMPTSAPGTLKMGFAASTGGSYNYHEIRNLNITQQVPDLTASKSVFNATTGGGSVAPGNELLYTVSLNNHTDSTITGVQFTDAIPENTTYVANSVSAPSGATLNATSPISITDITVPANGQVTLAFKVQVVNPIPVGVTEISNQGVYTYGVTTAQTDGDAVTEGNQPTVISVTAGPNFDTSTKTVTYEDLDNNGAVSPGDRLVYHVVLPNTGNQDAPTTAFTDPLPSNTTYVPNSATVSGGTVSYNSTTKRLNWTVSVDAGAQATLDFKVTVNSGVKIRDVISNQGTITYDATTVLTDADLATPGKQPTQILAGGGATLTATKAAEVVGGGALQPGGRVRYTIRLTNTGSYSVTGATFADTIPANTTYVAAATDAGVATYTAPALNVTGINLASRVTATIQLTVQLNSPLTGVTQINNQGVVNYDSNQGGANNTTLATDGDPATAGQQPTNTEIPHTDLAVTKRASADRLAEAGTVVYTVDVTNVGPRTADNVTVADVLPAALTYQSASATQGVYASPAWDVGSLPVGASATLMISVTVGLGQGGAAITNTASVTSTLYDPNPGNNAASAGVIVATTTLTGMVTDAATGAPLVGVTLVVTDSQGNLCTATTNDAGVYAVTSGQDGCLLAPGVATVAATGGAPTGYLLRAATTTIVTGAANIGNLALVLPVLSGFVTDLGSGVALVDATVTLTQGATVCTTTVGAGGAYRFEVGAGCLFTAGGATVAAAMTGYQPAAATPTILATGPTTQDLQLGTADLLILKDDGQTTVQPGQLLNYTLTVVNQGSITATAIVVTDTLASELEYVADDAGVTPVQPSPGVYAWSLGELAPGATLSFTLQARVTVPLPDGETRFSNYATLRAASPDRDRTNNEVADVDSVVAHPDLTLIKRATADSSPITAGGVVTYTFVGDNRGSAIATHVRITDTLDANTTYVPDSAVLVVGADLWPLTVTYSSTLHQLLLELPDMAPGVEGNLRYRATVTNPLPADATLITNTAEVSSHEPDFDPRDNHSTLFLSALPGSDIYVQKVVLPATIPARPGGQMLYRLRYGNLSSGIATAAVITDSIPANTSYVAGSLYQDGVNLTDADGDDAGSYLAAARTISVSLGSLAGGASGIVTFTVQIDAALPAGVETIANTAYIMSTAADPVPDDNHATAVMDVAAQPDLTIQKRDNQLQVLAGDLLTYTITYSNTGNQAAAGVQITDTLQAGLVYVAASAGGVYDAGAGTITWDIGALPVNELRTLTVTARVAADAQSGAVVANRVMVTDDGANGVDENPAGNRDTDSNVVIAPYIKLEKRATGPVYVGQPVTYTIEGNNSRYATAYGVIVTDTLPANTTLVPGSITGGGIESGGVITWHVGDATPGQSGVLSFAVIPNASAGGFTQTMPTLSTETISGTLTLTSSTTTPATGSRPWCDFDACAAFKGIYQGEDGTPALGWNDNPRLTHFDDTGWTPPVASSTVESIYWVNPAELGAEWVALNTFSETVGNFTFFRQPFCMPLNATGMSANVQVAGDDVSDIYLNGVYLGQEVGAGAADSFDASSGIQTGGNLLAVQLLNNRHGGHAALGGRDHSGLLFNLGASYTGLRPFVAAPAMTLAGQPVTFTADELALGGREQYSYTLDYGDGSPVAAYQLDTGFTHVYSNPGVYTATLTARAQYGCTGSDRMVITVLPATANLLANPAAATYWDATSHLFASVSGAGVELLPAADLSIGKAVLAGQRVPGQSVTYIVTVTNYGPNAVSGAVVSDTLPSTLTAGAWTCTASAATCTGSGSGNLLDTVNLQAGGRLTYTITGTLAAGASGLLENTAAVTVPVGITDLAPDNNVSIDRGPVTPQAALLVAKSSHPNPGLAPGQAVHYTVVVRNSGPSDASTVSVEDLLPLAVTGAQWTCVASSGTCRASGSGDLIDTATIAAGGVLTYTVEGTVDPTTMVGAVLSNTATATFAGVPVTATDANTLVVMTSLTVTKDALNDAGESSRSTPFVDNDSSGGISPNDTLKYRVVITNGASSAYDVVYNDALAAHTRLLVGSVTCSPACTVVQGNTGGDLSVSVSIANIAPDGVVTVEYQTYVDDPLPFQLATLANQGYAAAANAPAIASDDPTTAQVNDATVVQLTLGSIRGVAWIDDGDGVRQGGEPPLPQVAVTLYYTDTENRTFQSSANTDATGAYTFSLLAAGDYQVAFDLREGFTYSPVWGEDKDNKVDPSSGATAVLRLGANEQRANVSSGHISALEYGYLPASFANTLLAHDGARHIVPAAPAARLYLGSGITATADGVESPTATGPGDGIRRPLVPGWTPGTVGALTVTVSGNGQLWGWFDWNYDGLFGAGETQALGAVLTGTQSITLTVGTGYSATQPLFARFRLYPDYYALPAADLGVVDNGEVEDYGWFAIRGVVFDDLDGNGIRDGGDVGLAGFTVTVTGADGEVLAVVQSAADGAYVVAGLTTGVYTVTLTLPPNYAAITPTQAPATIDGTPTVVDFAVQARADLGITKVGAPDPVLAGERLHYTLLVTNSNAIAHAVVVTDVLPGAVNFVAATTGCTHASGVVTCVLGDLAITATATLTITADVAASAASGTITNTATVACDRLDLTPGNNDATALTTVNRGADLGVVKTSAPTPHVAGEAITYTIRVTSAGPSAVNAITVTDILPAGVISATFTESAGAYAATSGAWTGLALGAGDQVTLTIRGVVSATLRGALTNTASLATDQAVDANPANNLSLDVNPQAMGVVIGTVFTDANANQVQDVGEGAPLGASVIITDCQGVAQVLTPAANGMYTATIPTGPATVDVQVTPQHQQTVGVNPDAITVMPGENDAGLDGFVVPGRITGGVYADKNGNGALDAGEVGIADVLITLSGGVTTTTAADGVYTFTVLPGTYTIQATNRPGYTSTGDASAPNDDIIPDVVVAVEQLVSGQDFFDMTVADLSLAKTASSLTPTVGDRIIFTLTLSNSGPNVATGVTVSETLPGGYAYVGSATTAGSYDGAGLWTVGSVSVTSPVQLVITATVQASGAYANYAEVATCDQLDLNSTPGNGPQTPDEDDDASVTPAPPPLPIPTADLGIAKTSSPNPFMPGAAITYTLVVVNFGADPVNAITVTDILPAAILSAGYTQSHGAYDPLTGSWSGFNLAIGGRIVLTITGVVDVGVLTNLTNTATVTTTQAIDPAPGNNVVTDVNVRQSGVVTGRVYQDTNGSGVQDGDEPGLPDVTVVITDCLGVTHTVTSDAHGVYTATLPVGSAQVDVDAATLPPGMMQTGGVDPNIITVQAGLNDAGADGYQPRVRFDPALRVVLASMTLVAPSDYNPGEDVTFAIELYNQGAEALQNLELVDYLPAGMGLSPADANGWRVVGNVATLVAPGPLPAGQMTTIFIVLRVGDAAGAVVNGVEITTFQDSVGGVQGDADAVNDAIAGNDPVIDNALDGNGVDDEDDHDIATFSVVRVDAALGKRLVEGQISPVQQGDDVRYTLTITNQGSIVLGEVVVCDHIPAGFELSPHDANGWTLAADGRSATKSVSGSLAAGEAVTVEIVLRAVQPTETMARNWAEIIVIRDPEGHDLTDADSTPDNGDLPEDDTSDVSIIVTPIPTALLLSTFDIVDAGGVADLRWTTIDEAGLAGFLVYRSRDDQFANAVPLTPMMIPAAGVARSYAFVDSQVTPGEPVWYWLAAIMHTQAVQTYGPRPFMISAPRGSALYLPVVTR